ncbi:MAG: hypothetical protein MJE77_07945 [Proteobacteria bacterium]|nr:hypothetical protein [Pseudomonadota bacterium]
MKKQLPLLIGMAVGLYAIAEFFIPWHGLSGPMEMLLRWGQVLAAFAFVLGGVNVIQVNWPKIRRREPDWQYKVLLLASTVIMALVGIKWHTFGGERQNGQVHIAAAEAAGEQAVIRVVTARDDAVITVSGQQVDGRDPRPRPVEFALAPGSHVVKVRVDNPDYGYGEFSEEIAVKAGQVATVTTDLVTLWGPTGRAYQWVYRYIFDPCNSTMFALLAFFIASAAFRAFRARNVEAALLLGAAILIMLGRVPIGRAISDFLPELSDWIVDIPNNAGRRAIMIGAALGAIVTGLRVILGLERSHLGAGE